MKRYLILILCVTVTVVSFSQNIERIGISGKIVVDSDELENVSIYNTSSNKGTLTDAAGKFVIDVALNDILQIHSLQFKDFTVTIDKHIMASKKATIFLAENVNKLDEVVILPYDLTGNLVVDMESVRTFNPDLDAIYFGILDISAYEFPDDYKSEVENIAARGPANDIRYPLDAVALVGMLLKPRFKSNKEKQKDKIAKLSASSASELQDYYSSHYISKNFKIPEDQIDEFVNYVETNGLDYSLLEHGKEMEFLEFLSQKSKEFLSARGEKN